MDQFMNKAVKESIDIDYILNKIETKTPYGKLQKADLKPFTIGEEVQLREELDKVDKLITLINTQKQFFINLKNIFAHIKDLRQSVSRCIEGSVLSEVELFELKNFVILIRELKEEIDKISFNSPDDMKIKPIYELERRFDPRNEGLKTFYIYDEYSEELRAIREDKRNIQKKIKSEMKKLREKVKYDLGLTINPNGTVTASKGDTETINKIAKYPDLIYSSETYMNIKYSIKASDLIDYLEKEIDNIKKREEQEEFRIRCELSNEIAKYSKTIFSNMKSIGKIDLTVGKALLAIRTSSVKPEIKNEHIVNIVEGRHLKVEEALKKKTQYFTPITVSLMEGVTCITGANMGGKTVSLKLIGLLCAMAQYGLFVPCTNMELGLHGFVHISTGDLQSTDQGLSTFGAEIQGIIQALNRTSEKGLLLIDELARGTNPEEGCAISKAIVNYLKDKECITVITTHYDNVANIDNVKHLQVMGLAGVDYERLKKELVYNDAKGISIIAKYMDYRLKEVNNIKEVPRDAINIARLMGLDDRIIAEAERELK